MGQCLLQDYFIKLLDLSSVCDIICVILTNKSGYLFTRILFYAILFNFFRVVVDSNVAIKVHSKKVIESTKSFSFCYTSFSCIIILRFIITSDFFDVIKDSVTLSYTTVSKRPTIVDITSIFFPSMFVCRFIKLEEDGTRSGRDLYMDGK